MLSTKPEPVKNSKAKPSLSRHEDKQIPSFSGNPKPGNSVYFFIIFLAIGLVGYGLSQMSGKKDAPVVIDEGGKATLAPHREKKLKKELEEIDNAIQYSLRASEGGYFPCFTCPDGSDILCRIRRGV